MAVKKVRKKPPPAEAVDKALVGIVKVPGVEEEIRNLTAVVANQKPPDGGGGETNDDALVEAINSHAMAIRDHASVVQGNTDALNRIADALEGVTTPAGKATRVTIEHVDTEPTGS